MTKIISSELENEFFLRSSNFLVPRKTQISQELFENFCIKVRFHTKASSVDIKMKLKLFLFLTLVIGITLAQPQRNEDNNEVIENEDSLALGDTENLLLKKGRKGQKGRENFQGRNQRRWGNRRQHRRNRGQNQRNRGQNQRNRGQNQRNRGQNQRNRGRNQHRQNPRNGGRNIQETV